MTKAGGLLTVRWPVPARPVEAPAEWLWRRSWWLGTPAGATFVPLSREVAIAMGRRVVR